MSLPKWLYAKSASAHFFKCLTTVPYSWFWNFFQTLPVLLLAEFLLTAIWRAYSRDERVALLDFTCFIIHMHISFVSTNAILAHHHMMRSHWNCLLCHRRISFMTTLHLISSKNLWTLLVYLRAVSTFPFSKQFVFPLLALANILRSFNEYTANWYATGTFFWCLVDSISVHLSHIYWKELYFSHMYLCSWGCFVWHLNVPKDSVFVEFDYVVWRTRVFIYFTYSLSCRFISLSANSDHSYNTFLINSSPWNVWSTFLSCQAMEIVWSGKYLTYVFRWLPWCWESELLSPS